MASGEIQAARTNIEITYTDSTVTRDIAELLESFEFTNFASGEVDDLQVSFKDTDGRWLRAWYPKRGARLRAKIVWSEGDIKRELNCGKFVIDSPEYQDGITLKGTSAAVNTEMRRQKRVRMWKAVTLRQVVEKIAAQDGVTIVFQGADTPPLSKLQQKDISDLEFLLKCCQNEGYALRVDCNRLVVQQRAEFDNKPPGRTITLGDSDIIGKPHFAEDGADTYRACKVRYDHPDFKNLSAIYTPQGAPEDGPVMVIREHVASEAEALRRAKNRLELANRNRVTCGITLYGDTRLVAGKTVKLVGWGVFDGVYAIDKTTHSVPGYTTGLNMVKVG